MWWKIEKEDIFPKCTHQLRTHQGTSLTALCPLYHDAVATYLPTVLILDSILTTNTPTNT